MKSLYSVWLVPQKEEEIHLKNIINEHADQHNAPKFTPHLTLFPGIVTEYEKLKSSLDETFEQQKPFEVKVLKIDHSDYFFKTVFLEIELNQTLEKLFETLSSKTDGRNLSSFKPHISLIYKTLNANERLEIIEKINANNKFIINRTCIVAPKEGDEDYYDIENWRIPYSKLFS